MHTVLDIIHATDSVSQRVADAYEKDGILPQLSPKEKAESIIAKNRVRNVWAKAMEKKLTNVKLQVLKILSRSIKNVETALNPPSIAKSGDLDDESIASAMDAIIDPNQAPGDVLRDGMSGKSSGLGKHVPSLQKMAEDIGPVIDTFKAVLVG